MHKSDAGIVSPIIVNKAYSLTGYVLSMAWMHTLRGGWAVCNEHLPTDHGLKMHPRKHPNSASLKVTKNREKCPCATPKPTKEGLHENNGPDPQVP
jgi:hypothetical protein